jgi:O-antigen ligase
MKRLNILPLLLGVFLILFAFFIASLSQVVVPVYLFLTMAGIIIFIISFLNTEAALYIFIFSMLLGPEFIVGSGTGGKSIVGRGITFRLDDILLIFIGFSWFAKTAINKELGLFLKTPLNTPIAIYSLMAIFSTGWAIMVGRVKPLNGFFFVLKYLEYFIIYFMVVDHLRTQKQANRFVFCSLLTCFLVSLYGIYQIPTGQRVSAPFEGEVGEPNTFGGYLVFMLAIASGLFIHMKKETVYRTMLLILIPIAFTAFIFTLSRSAYLGFIPMYFSLLFFSEKKGLLLLILLLAIAAVLVSPFIVPTSVKERITFTYSQPPEPGQLEIGKLRVDTSTTERVLSWYYALSDFKKKPLIGYGVTGYRSFMDAQIPKILLDTGLLGLAAFFYLLYSIYRTVHRKLKEEELNPIQKGLLVGFVSGFIGLIFHSIGANTFIIVRIMEPFWLFAGIVVLIPLPDEEVQLEPVPETNSGTPFPRQLGKALRYQESRTDFRQSL